MALLVLAGFGTLMLASASSTEESAPSLGSVIRKQAQDIDYYNSHIDMLGRRLERVGILKGQAKNLENLKSSSNDQRALIESTQQHIGSLKKETAEQIKAFDEYKEAYRAMIRSGAKGEKIPTLTLLDGSVYQNVTIREVTPVGMQFSHEAGVKRVAYEVLPNFLQERFQYSAEQKELALKKERDHQLRHEADTQMVQDNMKQQMDEQKARAEAGLHEAKLREYAAYKDRLRELKAEIRELERAILAEKRKPVSHAPALEARLANKRREYGAIEALAEKIRSTL